MYIQRVAVPTQPSILSRSVNESISQYGLPSDISIVVTVVTYTIVIVKLTILYPEYRNLESKIAKYRDVVDIFGSPIILRTLRRTLTPANPIQAGLFFIFVSWGHGIYGSIITKIDKLTVWVKFFSNS